VPRFSSSLTGLRFVCLPALLLLQGCVGDSSGTTLYVYDNASSSVRVWDDVSVVYTAAQAGTVVAAPDRVIESSLYASMTLAWNGLAVDDTRNRLYLVSQAGTVYVIAEAKTQNGTLSSTSDITSFTLGESTERYSSDSVFGPASLDSSSDILYVMDWTVLSSPSPLAGLWEADRGQTLGRARRRFDSSMDSSIHRSMSSFIRS